MDTRPVENRAEDIESPIAPISRLRTDVLLQIFLTCLFNRTQVHYVAWSFTKKPQPAPSVILSHVCRPWRTLAFNSPLLWTKLEAAVPRPSYYTFLRRRHWWHHGATEDQRAVWAEQARAKWRAAMGPSSSSTPHLSSLFRGPSSRPSTSAIPHNQEAGSTRMWRCTGLTQGASLQCYDHVSASRSSPTTA